MSTLPTRTRILALTGFSYVRFMLFVFRSSIPPLVPYFVRTFHWTPVQVGLLVSAYLWTFSGLQIPWGMIVDRIGSTKSLIVGWLLVLVSSVAFPFGKSFNELVLYRLLFGIGAASVFVSLVVIVTEIFPIDARGRAIGVLQGASSLGIIASGAILPWLVSIDFHLLSLETWRTAYLMLGFPAVIAFVFLVAFEKSHNRRNADRRIEKLPQGLEVSGRRAEAFHDIRLYLVGAGFAGFLASYTIISTWIFAYLNGEYHLSDPVAGVLGALTISLPAIFSPSASGWLSDRLRSRSRVALVGSLAAALSVILIALKMSLELTVLVLFVYGVFSVFHTPLLALPAELWSEHKSGTPVSVLIAIAQFAAAMSPIIGGFVLSLTASYAMLWMCAVGAQLIGALALFFVKEGTP